MNKLMALCVSIFSYPLVSQVVFFMVKIIYLTMSDWLIAASTVVMNSCANITNSNAEPTNSTAKLIKSIAKVMNSITKPYNIITTCVII